MPDRRREPELVLSELALEVPADEREVAVLRAAIGEEAKAEASVDSPSGEAPCEAPREQRRTSSALLVASVVAACILAFILAWLPPSRAAIRRILPDGLASEGGSLVTFIIVACVGAALVYWAQR
jgi:hypothetical protein